MKKTKATFSDFFARYHKANFERIIFSFGIALVFSFAFVSFIHGGIESRGLMASVAQIADSRYGADIVLERTTDGADIVLGTSATDVSTISLTLLSDPEKLIWLTSSDALIQGGNGVYQISRAYKNETLSPGTVIAHLVFSQNGTAPVTISDTVLESDSVKYNLTSEVK